MQETRASHWLGIDIGSSRKKICAFCLIRTDAEGALDVAFEQGPAEAPYPRINTRESLLALDRPPTYLKPEIEAALSHLLDRSILVRRWLTGGRGGRPSGVRAVALDAPVALASKGLGRLTELASTQTFATPYLARFEADLHRQSDAFLRINVFWKLIGFALYRALAGRLLAEANSSRQPHPSKALSREDRYPNDLSQEDSSLEGSALKNLSQEELAAWTCGQPAPTWRLRETFPSDLYKRANGRAGLLSREARAALAALVGPGVAWRGVGRAGCLPSPTTLRRLRAIRGALRRELRGSGSLPSMVKRPGTAGDLWDAFACAYAAYAEDQAATLLHGWEDGTKAPLRLLQEGAILSVRTQTQEQR